MSVGPRRWFAVLAAVVVAIAPLACDSAPDEAADEILTIAFLRTLTTNLPGVENAFLDELRQTGFVQGRNLRVMARNPEQLHPDPEDARATVARWREQGVDRMLDVTRRIDPRLTRVGVAYPADPSGLASLEMLTAGAEALGLELLGAPFDDADGLEAAIAELAEAGVDVLAMSSSPAAVALLEETELAADEHGLPVVATSSRAGFALVTLYPAAEEIGRQLGRQASRLLLGESPATVPVETPRRFVLAVNAAVADRFGLEIPDDVIVEAQVVRS